MKITMTQFRSDLFISYLYASYKKNMTIVYFSFLKEILNLANVQMLRSIKNCYVWQNVIVECKLHLVLFNYHSGDQEILRRWEEYIKWKLETAFNIDSKLNLSKG